MIRVDIQMDKEDAIRAMLDGYHIIESTVQSKSEYQGEYCVYINNKFKRISPKGISILDPNVMVKKYWTIAKPVKTMFPKKIYKTNLTTGEILELNFVDVYDNRLNDKTIESILVYETYNKINQEITVCATVGDYFQNGKRLVHFQTEGIYYTRANAIFELKCCIEDILRYKKLNKKVSKTKLLLVENILKHSPELLI